MTCANVHLSKHVIVYNPTIFRCKHYHSTPMILKSIVDASFNYWQFMYRGGFRLFKNGLSFFIDCLYHFFASIQIDDGFFFKAKIDTGNV